ncbi:MAG: dihydroneopterin aldolase [Kiritimatiellae bacterium]|nr:dihydroneopterin aldolase [Kiritimatiellia bacterium]
MEVCGLEAECVLGVYEEERGKERPVTMDVALEVRTGAAAETDDFGKALNYERVEEDLRMLARVGQFRLVETLAEKAAAVCLGYPGVRRVRVRVEKPGALKHARAVAVSVERGMRSQE